MNDTFAQSPFSPAVNAELGRLLESSWKSDRWFIVPKNAGQLLPPSESENNELSFWDPDGGDDVLTTLPFNLRFLRAAFRGMQPEFRLDGLELSQATSSFQMNGRLWVTFLGTNSGDGYGCRLDAEGDDPEISRLMAGEGVSESWRLSEFLSQLSTTFDD